jgi:hypothetical protein
MRCWTAYVQPNNARCTSFKSGSAAISDFPSSSNSLRTCIIRSCVSDADFCDFTVKEQLHFQNKLRVLHTHTHTHMRARTHTRTHNPCHLIDFFIFDCNLTCFSFNFECNFKFLLSLLSYWGAFAKLWRATTGFVMSVRMKQLGYHWTDFHRIWYLRMPRKTVDRVKVSLKSDKNNVRELCMNTIIHISLNSSEKEKCFRPKV